MAVAEIIRCEKCRHEFGGDEASVCRKCRTYICPKCGTCSCTISAYSVSNAVKKLPKYNRGLS